MNKILGFFKLYRLDVALISFFLYLFGAYYVVGLQSFSIINVLLAFFISFISVNFIYSLNSWFDSDIDKINKPERPIPSGIITKKEAFYYSLFLLFLSFLYPLFFLKYSYYVLLAFIFPFIGIIYSNKIFSFKKNKYLALFTITFSLVAVPLISFLFNGGLIDFNFIFSILSFWFFVLSIVPFKDYSDVSGDLKYDSQNWFSRFSSNKVFLISLSFILISLFFILFVNNLFIKTAIIIQILSFVISFIVFYIFKINLKYFYKIILKVFIFNAFIYLCVKFFL